MKSSTTTSPGCLLAVLLAVMALASGCASVVVAPLPEAAPAGIQRCAALFERVERTVRQHGVRDDENHVVTGHPWVRASRFLASYRADASGAGLDQWLGMMAALDERARRHEIANLPPAARRSLGPDPERRLGDCRDRLVAYDRDHPRRVAELREAARVPDAYIEWRRVVGIYPVPGWFILQGVMDWQEDVRERFRQPPGLDNPMAYAPAFGPGDERADPLAAAYDNPLRIPLPDEATARRLLAAHAPVFLVDTGGDHDRPGRPVPDGDSYRVEPEPVVYTRLAHTRFQGRALLQLVYLVWFDARPRTGVFDMLGGRLDGLYWRVTLAPDGRPLLYDSMHPCGCYHMAFHTDRIEPRPPEGGFQEPLLVPRPAPAGEGRMRLYLESRTHYLVGLERGPVPDDASRYRLRDYHELRSGAGGGLFGEHGIVPGTDRAEELLFWPTGVRAPGAMRQWGNHATAFVGKRHFDDPDLIGRYFRERASGRGR